MEMKVVLELVAKVTSSNVREYAPDTVQSAILLWLGAIKLRGGLLPSVSELLGHLDVNPGSVERALSVLLARGHIRAFKPLTSLYDES